MKELAEAAWKLADHMLLTALVVFNLGAQIQEWPGWVLKVNQGISSPFPKSKIPDQLPQEVQNPEPTETEVGGKRESLWQQFASLFVYFCLHLFPSFSHPGALFQRPLPWSVSKSLIRSKLLTPVLLADS